MSNGKTINEYLNEYLKEPLEEYTKEQIVDCVQAES